MSESIFTREEIDASESRSVALKHGTAASHGRIVASRKRAVIPKRRSVALKHRTAASKRRSVALKHGTAASHGRIAASERRSAVSKCGFWLLAVLLLCMVCLPRNVRAADSAYQDSDPDDYITESFDTDVTADDDHVFHVTEKITVDFIQPHHGITRYIPYNESLYEVKNLQAENAEYEVFDDDTSTDEEGHKTGDKVLRIGSEEELLTGEHDYVVTYDLVCFRDDSKEEDYLALDLLPTGWETSIRRAELSLHLPAPVTADNFRFYSGEFGSGEAETADSLPDNIQVTVEEDGQEIRVVCAGMEQGAGLTVRAVLPEGYWVDPANHDSGLAAFFVIVIAAPAAAWILWLLFGRDPQVVRTVEFYPPDGMTPADVGYIIDGRIDSRDISSMLMYFGAKGYLHISEIRKNEFRVIWLREPDPSERKYTGTLFQGLFRGSRKLKEGEYAGHRYQDLKKLPSDFGTTIESVKSLLRDHYSGENRLFTKASTAAKCVAAVLCVIPAAAGAICGGYYAFTEDVYFYAVPAGIMMIAGLALWNRLYEKRNALKKSAKIWTGIFGTGLAAGSLALLCPEIGRLFGGMPAAGAAVVPSFLIGAFFFLHMKARTKRCAEWTGKILGFREFIRTAEYDRLKTLCEEDPAYFYNIMPYAYVMGMETGWAKRFTDIHMEPPEWYDSYEDAPVLTSMWYWHMMNTCTRNFSESFGSGTVTAGSADSGGGFSGGGFSGGGFSGGGFGGGGGGAW